MTQMAFASLICIFLAVVFHAGQTAPTSEEQEDLRICPDETMLTNRLAAIVERITADYKVLAPTWLPALYQEHLRVFSSPHLTSWEKMEAGRGSDLEKHSSKELAHYVTDSAVALYEANEKSIVKSFPADEKALGKLLFRNVYKMSGSASMMNTTEEGRRQIIEEEVRLHCTGNIPASPNGEECRNLLPDLRDLAQTAREKMMDIPHNMRHAIRRAAHIIVTELEPEEKIEAALVVAKRNSDDFDDEDLRQAIVSLLNFYTNSQKELLKGFPDKHHAAKTFYQHVFRQMIGHKFLKARELKQDKLLRRTIEAMCPDYEDANL